MNDKVKVAVTPQAWMELYKILYNLMGDMGQWSDKHDLPVQVTMGTFAGMYEVIGATSNACECDACNHVIDSFADELVGRMIDTSGTVH